ncbi:hypothetical protein PR202_gb10008 [Eleusine coracana subsp. coracana]|uniref:Growth-regulating factor n=1 Tax=Eleusine coracana subsp. coracana TaxID=191504 RepID=A0AAV5EJB4_ELECO|nr:hypothetical protein PR202_gb10008 [Eleusine coracana subsp. coracana]
MGYGRKADEDPEPGRCRRTDGKKWRCSKEAYPDSKYCEKHMHRGKNRSRKTVEMSLATPAPSSTTTTATALSTTAAAATSSPAPSYHHHRPAHEPYNALYGGGGSPYSAAAATRPVAGVYHHHAPPQQASPFHLHLDTTSPYYSVDQRVEYAYGHAASNKEAVGEHAFFSDGGDRDRHPAADQHQWQFKQLGVEHKPHTATPLFPDGGNGYGTTNGYAAAVDMNFSKEDDEEERRHQQQHCFVLGADLRLERPSSTNPSDQKPLRPFFDEWPHEKSGKAGSWMGLGGETQLSMSIPMAAANNDVTVASRYRNGVSFYRFPFRY